jgi:hypothetical protein
VPDADIVGRDGTADSLWRDLESNSLQISEMRRFGKSTILRLMEKRAPSGWLCVRTTVQDARSTRDLIDLTLRELLDHTKLREHMKKNLLSLGQQVDEIEVNTLIATFHLSPETRQGACQTFRSVLRALARDLKKENTRLAIMWDEFPDAIDAIRRKEGETAARDMLALLKASRQSDDGERLRWVLTGSVGFHHVQRALGGHGQEMGDITTRDVGPLAPEWTRWLATSLLLDIGLGDDPVAARAIAGASSGIPYIVEMMVKHLRDNQRGSRGALPRDGAAARRLLLDAASDPAIGAGWTPLLTKVDDYYGAQAVLAEAILDEVALAPRTRAETESAVRDRVAALDQRELRQVMDLLLDDRYLVFDHGSATYSWRHEALRLIWQAKRKEA